MSDVPSVCAVLLTRDRPEMTKQAVRSFEAQTYPAKRLVIYDTSTGQANNVITRHRGHYQKIVIGDIPKTIGELRNAANALVRGDEEIIVTFDSDDLSHANRISEQVQLLQNSGADCVGYREVLFWREPVTCGTQSGGEAWLYTNPDPRYCIGASLAYWRASWERHPFPALPTGPESSSEDHEWLKGVRSVGVSGLITGVLPAEAGPTIGEYMPAPFNAGPRLLCRIHGQNTMNYSRVLHEGTTWHRVPAWDRYCRERFA